MTTKLVNDYNGTFNKNVALKAMIDGIAIVQSTAISKRQYNGEYLFWFRDKFVEVNQLSSTNTKTKEIDVNILPSGKYELLQFKSNMIPNILWKSNVDKAEIKKLGFDKIIKYGHEITRDNHIWAICRFLDENGNEYGVKFKQYYGFSHKPNISRVIDTEGIHYTRSDARNRLRYWVDEQLKNQRKAKSRELKTTPKAQKILDELPEIFI